jgi:hypothetical protein
MLLQLLREERAVIIPTHHGHAIPKHFLWRPQPIVPTLGAVHVSGFIFQQSINPNRPISFKPIPSINQRQSTNRNGAAAAFFRMFGHPILVQHVVCPREQDSNSSVYRFFSCVLFPTACRYSSRGVDDDDCRGQHGVGGRV